MKNKMEILLHGHLYKKLSEKYMLPIREEHDLRQIDVEILYLLHCAGERNTSSDISKSQLFTKGHISQSANRLEQMGFITVVLDENDRRCTHLRLTNKAAALLEEIVQVRDEMYNEIFAEITPEEQEVMNRVIDKIENNMKNAL